MEEDLIKFQKLYSVLLANKTLKNLNAIADKSNIAPMTIMKIIKGNAKEITIRPSVLGKVQDFNKKYTSYFEYNGKVTDKELDDCVKVAKSVDPFAEKKACPPPVPVDAFWEAVKRAQQLLPNGTIISITINSKV